MPGTLAPALYAAAIIGTPPGSPARFVPAWVTVNQRRSCKEHRKIHLNQSCNGSPYSHFILQHYDRIVATECNLQDIRRQFLSQEIKTAGTETVPAAAEKPIRAPYRRKR